MKRRERWKENMVTALEIPRDLAYRDAIITLTGIHRATVENYRSILRYTAEEILILTPGGKVRICGKRLEIPWYTPHEMQVMGSISGIFMERQG